MLQWVSVLVYAVRPPTPFFVPSMFVMAYYCSVAMRGYPTDRTRAWTDALIEFKFTTGTRFIVNVKDGACSTYSFVNLRFENVFGELLFQLPARILDTLLYFGLYTTALWMETDPILTSLVFKRCMVMDYGKKATKDGFFRRDITSWKV